MNEETQPPAINARGKTKLKLKTNLKLSSFTARFREGHGTNESLMQPKMAVLHNSCPVDAQEYKDCQLGFELGDAGPPGERKEAAKRSTDFGAEVSWRATPPWGKHREKRTPRSIQNAQARIPVHLTSLPNAQSLFVIVSEQAFD